MPTLSYGLNLPKKSLAPIKSTKNSKSRTIFDDGSASEDGGDQDVAQNIDSFGGVSRGSEKQTSGKHQPSSAEQPQRQTSSSSQFTNLATSHTSKKHAQSAQQEDTSIYDYDTVYDYLHAQPKKKQHVTGPKYMQGLLDAAEIRKRDQLQAKDKMLAKEREAEGEVYADKEKFVTSAYKAQQEEVRKLAEEERRREEEAAERRRKVGGGMTGWYKNVLEREENRHAAIADALARDTSSPKDHTHGDGQQQPLRTAQQNDAMVNDDGQVVDKRELLSAGLNIKSKSQEKNNNTSKAVGIFVTKSPALPGNSAIKSAMRERQTRMLEAQLEQSAKRAADNEELEQEALRRAAKSNKSKEDVTSARERYLQRKREAKAVHQTSSTS
jgi:coiled-coil domain-containing protein 55